MSAPPFHIVLHQPEIPPNTGNIGRLCLATRSRLHLVRPLGFSLDEKALQRAGLDYWDKVDLRMWDDLEDVFAQVQTEKSRFFLLTTKAKRPYWDEEFRAGDYFIFGRETKGLPETLLSKYPQACLTIPMPGDAARSLNLATSVGIVLYEAIRQITTENHPGA